MSGFRVLGPRDESWQPPILWGELIADGGDTSDT